MSVRHFCLNVGWLALSLVVIAMGVPPRAEAAGIFEVRSVAVDITADNATAARKKALVEGQQMAFQRLLKRLTLAEDHSKFPQLSVDEIAEYVSDFSVSAEKTSPVRYLANLTYRFKKDLIRGLLRTQGIRFAETRSKPLLVLPIYQAAAELVLWDDSNAWLRAWIRRPDTQGLVPFAVPLGDLADIAAIGVEDAVRGEAEKLAVLAARYNAGDTVVAYARSGLEAGSVRRRVDVSVTRYSVNKEPVTDLFAVVQQGTESDDSMFSRAVTMVVDRVEDTWKRSNLLGLNQLGVTAVTVPISSLSDWLGVRRQLKKVAVIREIELVLLSLDEVRINVHYVGVPEQLQTALSQIDLYLAREEGEWVLYPAGAKAPGRS